MKKEFYTDKPMRTLLNNCTNTTACDLAVREKCGKIGSSPLCKGCRKVVVDVRVKEKHDLERVLAMCRRKKLCLMIDFRHDKAKLEDPYSPRVEVEVSSFKREFKTVGRVFYGNQTLANMIMRCVRLAEGKEKE